jgi:hypothetical protein
MYLEAMIEGTQSCTWRPGSCELGDVLGGLDRLSSEMHFEASIELNSKKPLESAIK